MRAVRAKSVAGGLPKSRRQAGWLGGCVWEGSAVIGYLAVMGVGYVFGTKAGRRRYEQIVGTYRAVTGNPATRSIIDAGRRKIASKVSPDGEIATFTEIDAGTTVIEPRRSTST